LFIGGSLLIIVVGRRVLLPFARLDNHLLVLDIRAQVFFALLGEHLLVALQDGLVWLVPVDFVSALRAE